MAVTPDESLYKILGTTAKISQRRIKEKYIEAVKKHPPETDPDQFEKIRQAYEVLKDPVKRKEYDISRKYGGKIENILRKASEDVEKGNFQKAQKKYNELLAIDPDNLSGKIGVMFSSIGLDDLESAYAVFDDLSNNVSALEEEGLELDFIYSVFSKMLIEKGYTAEAYGILEDALKEFPRSAGLAEPMIFLCLGMDKTDKALDVAEMTLPAEGEESFEDIDSYILWVHTIVRLGRWADLSKAQTRFRKFLKRMEDEEEKDGAFSVLMEQYEEAYIHQSYRVADIFIDLAKIVNVGMFDLKEQIKEVKKLVRIEKDFNRLFRDTDLFPLILRQAVHLYFDDEDHPAIQMLEENFTPDIINELEQEAEYYAAGILYLKKKYPAFYSEYKQTWDRLYDDLTQNFNREMKRGLRKLI
ncbi:DnaJ domain-containing protein [Halalkalibacterium halodurans]|uniref:J domain-containing protein n=1 Tax=Halalkalibacterium halodurans TaxID=86665 RepID=UPI001419C768|nr:DnaJ domain-containing protein [Halalkalibacterium halodurans]MED3648603.1 DnaJ domain-containing protein [Halalkalibacterium halodurans]